MVSSGTHSNFETRGNMHYRTGLNMIPLIEWYRANPDDFFLLEVAMGAQAGQLTNIDERGAPSMMLHMLPHVLDFDPRSGDFGLGFFGHTLEAGAYFVKHPTLGDLCFQCDLGSDTGAVVIEPRDSYRQRVYLEPLGLYIQADAGQFDRLTLNLDTQRLTVSFVKSPKGETFTKRRLRVDKVSIQRPGQGFKIVETGVEKVRAAFEFPASMSTVTITWQTSEVQIVLL
jgi:hypothetical protein